MIIYVPQNWLMIKKEQLLISTNERMMDAIKQYKIVPETKEFKFRKLCPYCSGDLTYVAEGWESDDDGLYMADSFDAQCSNEPDIESDEWEEWLRQHSDMPYVNWLPVNNQVQEWINERYRFDLKFQ